MLDLLTKKSIIYDLFKKMHILPKRRLIIIPEISALTSTYNSAGFVAETFESILKQTFEDFEFIVVDDCSTDDTVEIVKSFDDKRIKLFRLDKNSGVGAALSYGLSKVSGKFVAKVDSDDLYVADRFQKQKYFLDQNPDVALVKSLIEYFTDDPGLRKSERYEYMTMVVEKELNSVVTPEQISEELNHWNCIPHNSYMGRAEVIKKIGYDNLRQGEDYKLFYLISKNGYKMDTVREKLVKFRLRSDSVTGLMKDQSDIVNGIYDLKIDDLTGFLNNDKKLFVWGTGNQARIASERLFKDGYKIEGFIDRMPEKIGKEFLGITIHGHEEALNFKNIKILLCAQPARTEAIRLFKKMGYKYKEDYFILL